VIPLTLAAVMLAWVILLLYQSYSRVTIDVGGQASPQQIFFGTEYRVNDPSQIVIPIEVVAGVFFVLLALIFVGLGQAMGSAFNAIPDRIAAYTADIAGSLAGIMAFGIVSYLRTPPLVWFVISMMICLYLAHRSLRGPAAWPQTGVQVVAAISVLLFTGLSEGMLMPRVQTFWSPYYKINYWRDPADLSIFTNNIGHQQMMRVAEKGPAYVLPHLLHRDAGEAPFQDVLIIGAGSGNDVQAALSFGVRHVDAVEIDPIINELGRRHHPDQPFSDPRVTVHVDDGRSFVKKTTRKYDLVIYALVDSLVLHSGYSSLRLESFLFTREAFQEIKARLKPNGVFAMYNFYRQGWVVTRLSALSQEVFGAAPLVISLPYRAAIAPDEQQRQSITFLLAGNTAALKSTFADKKYFWLNQTPRLNQAINGFGAAPPRAPARGAPEVPGDARADAWLKIGPASVKASQGELLPADDWPFLYLRERTIPALNVHGMMLVAFLSLGLLLLFAPVRTTRLNWRMFFLGAGFMLLETKSVVHMALLFGSTWVVNSIVFGAVLSMILLSNLFVHTVRPPRLRPYYVLLIAALVIGVLVPMNAFLALPGLTKVLASCAITFVPIFFAGVIFATAFRDSRQPDLDFGSNIAGVILGGLCEFFSLALGFNNLLVLAMAFYLLSAVLRRGWLLRSGSPG